MSTATLPTPEVAHATVVDIHKRAFFGRLEQYGEVPQTEKEAVALLDLGVDLTQDTPDPVVKAAAADTDYGDGPYAQAKKAYDEFRGVDNGIAPGFGKSAGSSHFGGQGSALPELEPALVDAAYNAAFELAHDPAVYGAAVVKRAENERLLVEMTKQAGEEKKPDAAAAAPAETN